LLTAAALLATASLLTATALLATASLLAAALLTAITLLAAAALTSSILRHVFSPPLVRKFVQDLIRYKCESGLAPFAR
jgi:hypothetical protein